MKSVLCYGDSNTFGTATVERPDGRYGPDERWTGVLAAELGAGYRVIEEGLGGRTTVSDDPVEGALRNGRTYLMPCLLSHRPLDLVIIMLGTNDLKARFGKSAWEIAEGMSALVNDTLNAPINAKPDSTGVGPGGGKPAVIVVSPPPTLDELPNHAEMFVGGPEKSKALAGEYKRVADAWGVGFFDAGSVATSSAFDGFHLDPEAHAAIGRGLAAEVRKALG